MRAATAIPDRAAGCGPQDAQHVTEVEMPAGVGE